MARIKSKSRLLKEIISLVTFMVVGGILVGQGTPLASSPVERETPVEARYYVKLEGEAVQCRLCFRKCTIPEGSRGYCGVRENQGGVLYSLVYGKPCVISPGSPIEKLPLYHVGPGNLRFNVATAGCNFQCSFCHNWHIAIQLPEEVSYQELSPQEVVTQAQQYNLKYISFTYTEPTVFYEYMYDIAAEAREKGIQTLLNTNGAINPEPLRALLKHIDAVNVDLKAFTTEFYEVTSFSQLEPVLHTLKIIKESGVWLEIVNLLIPTLNDDPKQIRDMCRWIRENLGEEVPVHFNRFFPAYKLTRIPPTPIETLEKAREIALEEGLKYVYIGNVPGHEYNSTYCPQCGNTLIKRVHFNVLENNIEGGTCPFCGHCLPGIWG